MASFCHFYNAYFDTFFVLHLHLTKNSTCVSHTSLIYVLTNTTNEYVLKVTVAAAVVIAVKCIFFHFIMTAQQK